MSDLDRHKQGYRSAYGRYQETRKYGTGMIILFWIILMGLMVIIFGDVLERQINPNRRPETSESFSESRVVLKKNRLGHFVVSGRINNRSVDYIVDTGATSVVVPWALAEKLSLELGVPILAETANGVIRVYETRLETVQLGNISVPNVRANINPHMQGDKVLLGMSFLNHLELALKEGELTLVQQSQ
ncbi:MAG: TIGR02281 family clan AA aspartic protease [Gammaproteobacteria bacterium]|nr:TIGR02281 family clan AA aspartic protease [Gammaproteobacteria bacterium]MCY4227347.1 TIGR02281 family clan AA aspartic protease [Gammaproteobacteria bacterium]MCY4312168.1 TIGR02281 family clan AA aspartic protease [Gammaproteobacteria bacterium]